MYEIPVLAIVNEVYFKMKYNYDELLNDFKNKFDAKLEKLLDGTNKSNKFSDLD